MFAWEKSLIFSLEPVKNLVGFVLSSKERFIYLFIAPAEKQYPI